MTEARSAAENMNVPPLFPNTEKRLKKEKVLL
jgi:hypothetical protein